MHGSGLRADGQILAVTLPAMFRFPANPERLRLARIETVRANLAPPSDVVHEAPPTPPLSPGFAEAERSPVEHSVGQVTRIT